MTETFTTPLPRDRYSRPMVAPPGGGKPIPYTRMTTFVGATEDTYNLEKWKMRMVALGMVEREDLHLAVAAHREDKDHLNRLCDQALDAAKASAGATKGTALHTLTEQWDAGTLDLAKVPTAYRPDVQAYARATERLEVVEAETFGVLDDLKVGGTWDRLYRTKGGDLILGDLKTGGIEFGAGKIAAQLAGYTRCTPYDHRGPSRGTSNPQRGVRQDIALVVHLPAGKGTCELIEVDANAGWEAVLLAGQVRAWRARRGLTRPWAATAINGAPAATTGVLERIAAATTVAELNGLYRAHLPEWTPAYTDAAKARKTLLLAGM